MTDYCSCNCDTTKTCNCPSIIGAGQIDIDTSTPDVLEIFAPENSSVSSDDSSVVIVETENSEGSTNYDLSVTCCDSKVGACATDPLPGALEDKLFVSSPLTKTVSNCSVDGRVTIGINTALLTDEKVKVTGSSCSSGYIDDIIEAGDGIRTYVEDCKLKIEADTYKFTKPFVKVMLSADAEVTRTHALVGSTEHEGWFVVPVSVVIDNNGDSIADWITTETQTLLGTTTTVIKIAKAGFYRVSFNFNVDMNCGVHALRGCVWSTMTGKAIVLDDKDVGESYGYAISQNATVDASTDIAYSKQASFGRTDISYFDADTVFVLVGRLDPYVIQGNGSGQDGWIKINRAGLDTGTIGGGSVTENSESGCVMSVEWVSDDKGNILY